MKICLINNLYYPFARGGAERIVEIIFDKLKHEKHQVFIITTKPYKIKNKTLNKKIYYINSLYYNLNKIPKIIRLFWHLIDIFDIKNYFKIKKILKKEKPDIVMTHNLKGIGFLIPRVIKKLKIKHIHTLHDIQLIHPSGLMYYGEEKKVLGIFPKIYYKICIYLFLNIDTIISPSQWLLKEHTKKGFFKNSNKKVIPNPVILKNVNFKISKFKKINNFLYVGQLEKHKGIMFLIDVFLKLNLKLIIAGSGSYKNKIRRIDSKNKNIIFVGQKNNKEILNLMQSADCLIVPSFCYENSPTVIYEAAMLGLPVIASKIGGITDLIHDLGGFLFFPLDEKDLISKIKYAIKNLQKFKKIGKHSKEKIKKYSINNYIKKIVN